MERKKSEEFVKKVYVSETKYPRCLSVVCRIQGYREGHGNTQGSFVDPYCLSGYRAKGAV